MKTISSALLLLIVSIGWPTSNGSADCIGLDKSRPDYDPRYYSVAHELKRAKYVVEARAIREVWLGRDGRPKPLEPPFQFGYPRPWGFDPYFGVYYTIEIIEAYKGNPPDYVKVFSENSNGRFWMKVGQEYILFITEEEFGDPAFGQPPLGL